jgi:hypothetical protein
MSNDELYGDGGGESGGAGDQPSAEPKEDQGEQSAVIPKSLCPGMKPGDVIELKISDVRDDSYVVSYERGEDKEKESEDQTAPQAPAEMAQGGGSPMSAMME